MKRKPKPKKQNIVIVLGIILLISLPVLYFAKRYLDQSGKTETPAVKTETTTKVEEPAKASEATVPTANSLVVPYTVQAPYGNWVVHEESCEEAALLMYHQFLVGQKTDITPDVADREIREMKIWQVNNYGSEPDLSIVKLGQFAQSYYGHKPTVIESVDIEKIKNEITAGHPVLVPVMTQTLKNPHYSPGNVYHILVIKGYDATGVVTNDAGIKEGKDWHYSWDILFSAIDAANTKIAQGRAGLVLTNN